MTDGVALLARPEFTFLHEARAWDATVRRLDRPAVSLDLPGGRSARAVAAAVAGVLADGAPQILVGHGRGGAAAIAVARLRPDLVRALVLVDVTPDSEDLWAALERSAAPTLLIRAKRGGLSEMAVAEFAERVPAAWIFGVDAADAVRENPAELARLIGMFGEGRPDPVPQVVTPAARRRPHQPHRSACRGR
ncbi:hypothetical protein GCM10010168_70550 [Actinoplanes ianthinogenes]|uniref:AB hydrolase-1 domain-containing protein n=1 Tax=Actinoplanes ianthinogenes TaxID=122358 RepID=A0ABN6CQ56_9ACTN|nr:alpha/beta hydrolase [Actinoplanes ianthinogenes]BCJ47355.1 hypothetical protein Aiant_80120 [Actinoplanes ianthinogenes]GGR41841.1 hypothetical protein GCM10010168_70550 [Actinoplanes ianthinogenes]